jgi:hypothetical protein
MKYLLLSLLLSNLLFAEKFYYEFGEKVEIDNNIVTKKSFTTSNDPINQYTTKKGDLIKFKNEVLVQCNKNTYCEDDFEDLNLSNYKKIASSFFLIKIESKEDIFLIMQNLNDRSDIKSAHPNYIRSRMKR